MSCTNDKKHGSQRAANILLVDDHPLVRERLAEIINSEPDLRVSGQAADPAEALEAISRCEPDLVIVDLALRQSHGLDLIKDICARYPRLPMLVVSMHDESLYAERVIRAGARGYITKQQATRNILVAIRRVLTGHIFLSETQAAHMASRIAGKRPEPGDLTERLTDRELRIFELIGQGYAVQDVADQLHLDIKTVETYRARIKTKLNLKNANEVLRLAIRWSRDSGRG